MPEHTPAVHETPRYLVRMHDTRAFSVHIVDAAGRSLCKCGLNLTLWQLRDQPLPNTVVCYRCRVVQAKLARS